MNKSFKIALAVGALTAAGGAYAGTATTSFAVSTNVLATCAVTATPMAFANYVPGGADVDQTSTVNVRCTTGTTYQVGLDEGNFAGATVTTRRMTGTVGGSSLEYSLFRDAGRTANWGVTLGVGGDVVAATGNGMGAGTNHLVYGRVPNSPANVLAPAGTYTDTIDVTVTY